VENIFIVLLCHTNDKKTFGNNITFSILIEEQKFLETTGIQVLYDGVELLVKFTVCLILGDNIGLNSILRFTEYFSANYFCRFCLAPKAEIRTQLVENNEKLHQNKIMKITLQ